MLCGPSVVWLVSAGQFVYHILIDVFMVASKVFKDNPPQLVRRLWLAQPNRGLDAEFALITLQLDIALPLDQSHVCRLAQILAESISVHSLRRVPQLTCLPPCLSPFVNYVEQAIVRSRGLGLQRCLERRESGQIQVLV